MRLFKLAVPMILATSFAVPGALGQSSGKASSSDRNLAIGHIKETEAVDRLFESVERLRQASVLLTNKEVGPERKKAFDAAQDAVRLVQNAMAQLPAGMYSAGAKERSAKEWPVIAARLDEATQELQGAIKAMRDKAQGNQSAAVDSAHQALVKARQALAALPAWTPSQSDSAATGGK